MKAHAPRLVAFGIAFAVLYDQASASVVFSTSKSKRQFSPVGINEGDTLHADDKEDQHPQLHELRRCAIEQLLPTGLGGDFESRWTPLADDDTRRGDYDCSCAFSKASYFCPHGRTDFPVWVPKAVGEKECLPVSRDALAKDPFPPGTSILFYGNSHLRQVFEGIMCRYAERIVSREAALMLGRDNADLTMATVDVDKQCRGCMPRYEEKLSAAGCLHKEEFPSALRCCDDQAVYELDNNVTVHYWFAHHEGNKSIEHSFQEFGTSMSDYDVVVANSGNKPVMDTKRTVASAQHFHQVGVPFLWLATYDGVGNINDWEFGDREAFLAAKGNHIPVNNMMETMSNFTMGAELGSDDDHFCLPGPPDEVGLLILQLVWALTERMPSV